MRINLFVFLLVGAVVSFAEAEKEPYFENEVKATPGKSNT
jgi:hypothetical protein